MGQGRLEVIRLVGACDTGRCSVESDEASRVCAGGALVDDAIGVVGHRGFGCLGILGWLGSSVLMDEGV
ncbi:hypothetical protein [Bartonella mastomydis]|uniref:hypothetical protein n=1 Tax=Bartonella mastomydis TaxID=1820002 RepID=UPI0015D59DBC|nr:hypothetical protein [Bartonella mastomydis]